MVGRDHLGATILTIAPARSAALRNARLVPAPVPSSTKMPTLRPSGCLSSADDLERRRGCCPILTGKT